MTILIAIVLLFVGSIKVTSGWNEPRKYLKNELNWENYYKNIPEQESQLRNATEEELLNAGFKTELIEIDGRDCILKQNKIFWCE